MADSGGDPEKWKIRSFWGVIGIVLSGAIKLVRECIDDEISFKNILTFLGNGGQAIAIAVVVCVLFVCVAYIIVERNRQMNKTIRSFDKNVKKDVDELKQEVQKLEKEKQEKENAILQLSIENVKLEKENEFLKKYETLQNENLEQRDNKIGGQGVFNVVHFEGRNGAST